MHHGDGRVAEELQAVIPVADAVHGILCRCTESQQLGSSVAVGRQGGSCQCAGAQRAQVHSVISIQKPFDISAEHLEICHENESDCNRLCVLDMCKSDSQTVSIFFSLVQNYFFKVNKSVQNVSDFLSLNIC